MKKSKMMSQAIRLRSVSLAGPSNQIMNITDCALTSTDIISVKINSHTALGGNKLTAGPNGVDDFGHKSVTVCLSRPITEAQVEQKGTSLTMVIK